MALSPRVKSLLQPAVVLAIAALAFALALAITARGSQRADDFFYDSFYRLRPVQDMSNSDVVLVAVDDRSLDESQKPWPWPRTYWGEIATFLDHAGAKVIAFDIVFPNPSYYRDDAAFAAAMNALKTPVIYGSQVQPDGSFQAFAPDKIQSPSLAAVNLGKDKMFRAYPPEFLGQPSLAEATASIAGMNPDEFLKHFSPPDQPFLLHYYGPHLRPDGSHTFRFVPAYEIVKAQQAAVSSPASAPSTLPAANVSPSIFKDKIVIVCAIAIGTFDLKSSPLSDEYPGSEVQATAIENLLHNQQAHPVSPRLNLLATSLCALLVSLGIVYPRRAYLKVAALLLITLALLATCTLLFRHPTIYWLSPVRSLLAILIAAPLAFGWTFFTEDRQRRFMMKALSKVVSPAVAQQLAREPGRLALGTTRTEITVLFSDLANFTDLAEGMEVQALGKLVNRYLGEMSQQVIRHDGTLDKYIGDALMCFWNAPLPQPDHAPLACRTALAMIQREKILLAEFASLTSRRIFTRIGINTASVAVGFIGSEHLFNYTALGDGVNLASRLEGASKLYGSQILLSEPTAALVRDAFYMRQLDVLRVKGKNQPMPVYELLAEKTVPDAALEDRIHGYDAAFGAYQKQEWDRAEQLLLELSARFGEDAPLAALLARVRNYRQHPPVSPWDGVYISTSK